MLHDSTVLESGRTLPTTQDVNLSKTSVDGAIHTSVNDLLALHTVPMTLCYLGLQIGHGIRSFSVELDVNTKRTRMLSMTPHMGRECVTRRT